MQRRRGVSWIGLFFGLAVGLGITLTYTWVINPVIEYDTAPWQLGGEARDQYMAMIAQAYLHDGDLDRAAERLKPFGFERPGVEVARTACDFFRGAEDPLLTAALVNLARAFDETTCADIAMPPTGTPHDMVVIVVPTGTPTITPIVPTATPTKRAVASSPKPTPTETPSPTPAGAFVAASIAPFCNPRFSGALEIYVREADETGVPGVEVQVTWAGGADRFFTGLLPGEDPGFANFTMEAGRAYRVQLPGLGDATRELTAQVCTPQEEVEVGQVVLSGYAVIFER